MARRQVRDHQHPGAHGFLNDHPDIVKAFLEGHVAALDAIKKDPKGSSEAANDSLQSLTGSSLDPKILSAAWDQMDFTADPLTDTLVESATHAEDVGLLDKAQVDAAGACQATCTTWPS